MRPTSAKEIEAVLRLDGKARYAHFIKRVVDSREAWGLWNEGWALLEDETGTAVFPLWPAAEYAQLFCEGQWSEYAPERIDLDDLLDDLLPKLAAKSMMPAVFPTPSGQGVTPLIADFEAAIRRELQRYGE